MRSHFKSQGTLLAGSQLSYNRPKLSGGTTCPKRSSKFHKSQRVNAINDEVLVDTALHATALEITNVTKQLEKPNHVAACVDGNGGRAQAACMC